MHVGRWATRLDFRWEAGSEHGGGPGDNQRPPFNVAGAKLIIMVDES